MAKRLKNLGDWKLLTEDASLLPGTPPPAIRRTRRSTHESPAGDIRLVRESDSTTLKKGDCVLVSGQPKKVHVAEDSYVAVVVNIKMGVDTYLDVLVVPFVRFPENTVAETSDGPGANDAKNTSANDPQGGTGSQPCTKKHHSELLITAEITPIQLKDVVQTVKVLSSEQFAQVAAAVSSTDLTFLCCRATDRYVEKISGEFDFGHWQKLLAENVSGAVGFLAEKTSVIVSPSKKKLVANSPAKGSSTRRHQRQESHSPSPSPSKRRYADSSSSETDTSDPESATEDESRRSKHKRTPSKKQAQSSTSSPAPITPRRRNRDSARATEAFKQVVNVLSPFNKGFKVKSGLSLSGLPSFSLSGRDGTTDSPATTSRRSAEAFRELKEKLHTSTRIAQLPCREEQFEEIYMNLESAVMDKMGTCLYISGTPGVGKTATVHEAVGALRDNVQQGWVDDFDFLDINCLKLLSPASAYERLWEHLSGIKVTPSNAALLLEEYFGRADVDAARKPLIVLLDELDQLVTKNQKVIYNFFNWPTYTNSRLIVIAISNTMDLPERALSNKIASRLGLKRLAFRGYTEAELGVIISHRLRMLSESNKRIVEISPDAMRFASKKVSLVSGDARRVLTICRRAVEIAEQEYLDTNDTEGVPAQQQSYSVRTSHIGMAISETVNSPVAQVLARLPFAAKLVLVGVLLRIRRSGLGENPLGDVVDEMRNSLKLLTTSNSTNIFRNLSPEASYWSLLYNDVSTSGTMDRVRMRYIAQAVSDLVEQGILLSQNIRSSRFRLVSLNISEDEITSVLRRDSDIAAML